MVTPNQQQVNNENETTLPLFNHEPDVDHADDQDPEDTGPGRITASVTVMATGPVEISVAFGHSEDFTDEDDLECDADEDEPGLEAAEMSPSRVRPDVTHTTGEENQPPETVTH